MNEREFMGQIANESPTHPGLADILHWQWVHFRPGQNRRGMWQTPTRGPLGEGWPDLLLVRPGRLILAELKTAEGRVEPVQQTLLDGLRASLEAGPVDCRVRLWRPDDLPAIAEELR